MKPIYDYDGETGIRTLVAWEISFEELERKREMEAENNWMRREVVRVGLAIYTGDDGYVGTEEDLHAIGQSVEGICETLDGMMKPRVDADPKELLRVAPDGKIYTAGKVFAGWSEYVQYMAKLEAVAEGMRKLFFDRFYFHAMDQCWRCGEIGGHGYKAGGNVCEFKALEDLENLTTPTK